MVKDKPHLARELANVKSILHQQEHVHIIGVGFCSGKGTKDDKACQMPGA